MKQSNEFDTILDECLERIIAGESVEACLERYPDHADELRPLLATAFDAKDAADIAPRPEFRQEAARQFQQALHDLPVRKPVGTFSFRHWWVTAVTVLVVVVFGGGGTVFAANSAQPDNYLYPVKLVTENVRISLAGSDQAKAELYAEFANRRVDEIVTMASKGDAAGVEKATSHLDNQLVAMAGVVGAEENYGMLASKAEQTTTQAPLAAPSATATTTTRATVTPMATQSPVPAPTTVTITQPTITTVPTASEPPETSETLGPAAMSGPAGTGVGLGGSSFEGDVANQAAEAAQKLQDALNNAPESARQGLEHALEVVTSGYGKVLHGLRK